WAKPAGRLALPEFDVLEDRTALSGIVAAGAGPGQPPRVQVYDAQTGERKFDFLAFEPRFRGGVRVALGDVNGDGSPDLIAGAGRGGSPRIRVFDGETGNPLPGAIGSFLAFSPN